ncbi:hypothetical protein BDR26DRAFT_902408 [Obelidium mucronatum]|nr:hypothetical protein BDR26DRAFT_902408 [Obelidium mucronatum]
MSAAKRQLPKGLKAREKGLSATPAPVERTPDREQVEVPTKKHNPFEKAEQALFILASVILWLYFIGLVTGKPLLGVLLVDPWTTVREILLGPFKLVGNAVGIDVETLIFGSKTVAESLKVAKGVVDEF